MLERLLEHLFGKKHDWRWDPEVYGKDPAEFDYDYDLHQFRCMNCDGVEIRYPTSRTMSGPLPKRGCEDG